jgi:hypothetical protein
MYLFRVKKPEESHGSWDLYNLVETIAADQAFRAHGSGWLPISEIITAEHDPTYRGLDPLRPVYLAGA